MKIKQTAGRDSLGEFAPEFAKLNDDVLFGEVWSSDGLSPKTRSILTITVLVSKGLIDNSFAYHLQTAKEKGGDNLKTIIMRTSAYRVRRIKVS